LVLFGSCRCQRGNDVHVRCWFAIGCLAWIALSAEGLRMGSDYCIHCQLTLVYFWHWATREDLRTGYFL
jgi:hypothetical protein